MVDFKTTPPRSLNTFGIAGLLEEKSIIYRSTLLSTKHVGKVSDLLVACLRERGTDEVNLRSTLMFNIVEAYRLQLGSAQEPNLTQPLSIEAGGDSSTIALGVSFVLAKDLIFDLEGYSARVSAGPLTDPTDILLSHLTRYSDKVVARYQPKTRKYELIALLSLDPLQSKNNSLSAELIPVKLDDSVESAPQVETYVELGDVNYNKLLEEDKAAKAKQVKDKVEEILKSKKEKSEEQTLGGKDELNDDESNVKGKEIIDDNKKRISGGEETKDGIQKLSGSKDKDDTNSVHLKSGEKKIKGIGTKNGSDDEDDDSILVKSSNGGNKEKSDDNLIKIGGNSDEKNKKSDGLTLLKSNSASDEENKKDLELNDKLSDGEKKLYQTRMDELNKKIAALQNQLEKSQEVKPSSSNGTSNSSKDKKEFEKRVEGEKKEKNGFFGFLKSKSNNDDEEDENTSNEDDTSNDQSDEENELNRKTKKKKSLFGRLFGDEKENGEEEESDEIVVREPKQKIKEKDDKITIKANNSDKDSENSDNDDEDEDEDDIKEEENESNLKENKKSSKSKKKKRGLFDLFSKDEEEDEDEESDEEDEEEDEEDTNENSKKSAAELEKADTESQELTKELQKDNFTGLLSRFENEAKSLMGEKGGDKVRKLMDNFMSDLNAEKSKLHETAIKLNATMMKKQNHFITRERELDGELKQKEGILHQKDMTINRMKEQLLQAKTVLEKTKGQQLPTHNPVELEQNKQKYYKKTKMLAVQKDTTQRLAKKLEDLRSQLTESNQAARSVQLKTKENENLTGKLTKTELQLDEIKRANIQLLEKLNESKKSSTKVDGNDDLKKKLELATKTINLNKKQVDDYRAMVAKLEAESKRLKAELQKKQAEMIAKSVKSGGSGNSSGFGRGGGGTPPKAA